VASATIPLCVDLDGTVLRSDMVWEGLAALLKRNPFALLLIPFWFFAGRAAMKRWIARHSTFSAAILPYDHRFLDHLRALKSSGRRLILVTASEQSIANDISAHLGLFDEAIGSDGVTNLRGEAKGAALAARFGERGFDYAGNSSQDLAVWAHGREAVVVNASPSLAAKARGRFTIQSEFPKPGGGVRAFFRLLRPHQWVKNLIVFTPLLTAHRVADASVARPSLIAFLAFSLCASGVYALNDLLDLESDRSHPTKKNRPLASGVLPLAWGFVLAPLLMAGGGALAAATTPKFSLVLGLYALSSFAYSLRIKQVPVLDVFVLAGLYTLRLIGGHAATGLAYSEWLLAFSMFFFLSLALVKRFHELRSLPDVAGASARGRGYVREDLRLLAPMGAASGYLAVLVLALYATSEHVRQLYHQPALLLVLCPLFLYWISRVWWIAHRGGMQDDPVVFALTDWPSYLVGILTLAIVWLAT
jgi:4-hydroxybenzoate polyprenyltransferase/phosphoserine phosphatase